MSAHIRPPTQADSAESADFCLTPEEIGRGRLAYEACLDSVKAGDPRRFTSEAFDVLAAVISGGVCEGKYFPWQQVRGYHAALTLSIVKEVGAPSQIEALLCRNDDTRKFQQVADRYTVKQINRMTWSLKRVIEECRNLGFLDDDEFELAQPRGKDEGKPKAAPERTIVEGEVRALIAASAMDTSCGGPRDALMLGLAFSGGLRTIDLVNLNLDDLHFDKKTGKVTVKFKAPGTKRARRISLRNDQLIALEDWLAARGRTPGALFCPIARQEVTAVKRMSAAEMRQLCDRRGEEAGVLPFVPNDLARSGLLAGEGSKRRARAGAAGGALVTVSPLYEDRDQGEREDEQIAARIHFPYRARPGL